MTEVDVKAALNKIITDIQTKSSLECPPLTGTTKPLVDVPEFDSRAGVLATVKLARALQIEIPPETNIFVDKATKTNLSIDQVAKLVAEIAGSQKKKDAA